MCSLAKQQLLHLQIDILYFISTGVSSCLVSKLIDKLGLLGWAINHSLYIYTAVICNSVR